MALLQIGETWTGTYEKEYEKTFKVVGIMPIRQFMELEADKLQEDHPIGEEANWAGMLREKINAGDYDRYVNAYFVHYTKHEYTDGAYHILLESGLHSDWENLRPVV